MPSRVPKVGAPASDDAAVRLDDARRRLAEFVRQLDPKQAPGAHMPAGTDFADASLHNCASPIPADTSKCECEPANTDRPKLPPRSAAELARRAVQAEARVTAGRSLPRDSHDVHIGLVDDVAADLAAVVNHGTAPAAGGVAAGASELTYVVTVVHGDREHADVVPAEAIGLIPAADAGTTSALSVPQSVTPIHPSVDQSAWTHLAANKAVAIAPASPSGVATSASSEHSSDAAAGSPVSAAVAALGLPPRLTQTLAGLLAGRSEKQVARELEISPHTVHTYVKQLHKRLGVASRGELLARFIRSL